MTVRRLKTYTGSQGYVYQYYFVGQRASASDSPATEYIFDVTSDRKTTYAVSVFLPQQVVAAWNQAHGRALTESEQYVAAKLCLFRAFDGVGKMQAQGRHLEIDLSFLEESLGVLGVE